MLVYEGQYKDHKYWIRNNEGAGYYCGYAESNILRPIFKVDEPYEKANDLFLSNAGGVSYIEPYLDDIGFEYKSDGIILGFDLGACCFGVDRSLLSAEGRLHFMFWTPDMWAENDKKHIWTLDEVKEECRFMIDQLILHEKQYVQNHQLLSHGDLIQILAPEYESVERLKAIYADEL